jgi:hypothetical protein
VCTAVQSCVAVYFVGERACSLPKAGESEIPGRIISDTQDCSAVRPQGRNTLRVRLAVPQPHLDALRPSPSIRFTGRSCSYSACLFCVESLAAYVRASVKPRMYPSGGESLDSSPPFFPSASPYGGSLARMMSAD